LSNFSKQLPNPYTRQQRLACQQYNLRFCGIATKLEAINFPLDVELVFFSSNNRSFHLFNKDARVVVIGPLIRVVSTKNVIQLISNPTANA